MDSAIQCVIVHVNNICPPTPFPEVDLWKMVMDINVEITL